jgi:hypothetical protein
MLALSDHHVKHRDHGGASVEGRPAVDPRSRREIGMLGHLDLIETVLDSGKPGATV